MLGQEVVAVRFTEPNFFSARSRPYHRSICVTSGGNARPELLRSGRFNVTEAAIEVGYSV